MSYKLLNPVTLQVLDDWNAQIWRKPQKGSSPITFFENPASGETFFFKESHQKYPTEYWSEILASKFGQYLGLNVLDYNLGLYEGRVGCLSKHMLDKGTQELYHGVDILNDHLKSFIVTDKPAYSYQDIVAVSTSNIFFGDLLSGFRKMMVFDALIGNGDRHSENWALIVDSGLQLNSVIVEKSKIENRRGGLDWRKTFLSLLKQPGLFFKDGDSIDTSTFSRYTFSPIYDSGSCLGRELTEDKITKMITDKNMLQAYLNRGKSEVRWQEETLKHVELIQKIKDDDLALKAEFVSAFARCGKDEMQRLVDAVAGDFEELPAETSLSSSRKTFLTELLFTRTEFMKTLFVDG